MITKGSIDVTDWESKSLSFTIYNDVGTTQTGYAALQLTVEDTSHQSTLGNHYTSMSADNQITLQG